MTTLNHLAIAKQGLAENSGKQKHILILGAGLAGLVAGHELRRVRHRVTLLEARTRPGGRIFTLRDPFAPGLYAEAGAMRIPKAHRLTQHYTEHFGLKLEPFWSIAKRAFCYFQGQQWRFEEIENDPTYCLIHCPKRANTNQ